VVTILIESIIACILFTLVIFIMMKNPINMIHDYPPAIQNKAKELGIITDEQKGFLYSYLLWNIVDWWDAIFIDCIWFCHSKKVIIPGTEGMKEYKDYLFHIKESLKGMLFGLPTCVIVGLFVLLFKTIGI